MRKKISAFLATKEMTQKAFLAEINVNPGSLNNFLKLKGEWNGTGKDHRGRSAQTFCRGRSRSVQDRDLGC